MILIKEHVEIMIVKLIATETERFDQAFETIMNRYSNPLTLSHEEAHIRGELLFQLRNWL